MEENNKLIAEFMGGVERSGHFYGLFDGVDITCRAADGLFYDTSWNWLMPVLKKIKENIPKKETYQMDLYNNIMIHHQELDLDKTYQAVILYLQK